MYTCLIRSKVQKFKTEHSVCRTHLEVLKRKVSSTGRLVPRVLNEVVIDDFGLIVCLYRDRGLSTSDKRVDDSFTRQLLGSQIVKELYISLCGERGLLIYFFLDEPGVRN